MCVYWKSDIMKEWELGMFIFKKKYLRVKKSDKFYLFICMVIFLHDSFKIDTLTHWQHLVFLYIIKQIK